MPDPLVPAEVDLRDFPFMPLHIEQLKRSRAWLKARRRPELGFYMLNLWTGSWHELPAGSLENDEDVLADMARCDGSRWDEVKADALHGWVKCSDGRLYHPIVAKRALESWDKKLEQRRRTLKARIAALEKRLRDAATDEDRGRINELLQPLQHALSLIPPKPVTDPAAKSATKPVTDITPSVTDPATETKGEGEGQCKGEGEGEGEGERQGDSSLDISSGADAPSPDTDDDEAMAPLLPLDRSDEARIVVAWNAAADAVNADLGHAEWPTVRKLGPKRKAAVKRLLKTHTHADIERALQRAMSDPWARGEKRSPGHADWQFNFDYFAKEHTVTSYLEKPDGERPRYHDRNERSTAAAIAGLREELDR